MVEQNLWIPSDDLLTADPIAAAKITNPHPPPALSDAGVVLPDDHLDDVALEAAAASALAELDDDVDAPEEDYALQADDEAIDAPDDTTPGDDA